MQDEQLICGGCFRVRLGAQVRQVLVEQANERRGGGPEREGGEVAACALLGAVDEGLVEGAEALNGLCEGEGLEAGAIGMVSLEIVRRGRGEDLRACGLSS